MTLPDWHRHEVARFAAERARLAAHYRARATHHVRNGRWESAAVCDALENEMLRWCRAAAAYLTHSPEPTR